MPEKLLLVTAGSGITPVIGMLRNLFSRAVPFSADIVLLHSALSRSEVIFGDELRRYAAEGRLRLIELHTDTHGMLDVDDLDTIVPDIAERTTYACGPAGLLEALEAHHAEQGLPLHLERFRSSVVVTGEGGTLTFGRTGTVVEAGGDKPILDAAEEAGVLMPSGCRMGICFGCVLPLREGAVRDLRNGEITTAAPGDGVLIQTCVSAAAGACDIDH
jgi:ferredoxin-NADP reductase